MQRAGANSQGSLNGQSSRSPRKVLRKAVSVGRLGRSGGTVDEGKNRFEDFDIGNFFNLAEFYGDGPYMEMAVAFFERAPSGNPLRTSTMSQNMARKYQDSKNFDDADPDTMNERDMLVKNNVVYNLPAVSSAGVLSWDKVSYRLPVGRDKEGRDGRIALLKFLDYSNTGKMTVEDLKTGFARIVTLPCLEEPDAMLDQVIRLAQRAVQELMLDGPPRYNNDIITKEFRIFLLFFQGYLDLWEIYVEVETSGDEIVSIVEFTKCAPKLVEWGMKDPALVKNPSYVFAQIDKDESGYVTFGEFADYCVRKGVMEDVAKDLRSY